MAKAIEKFFEGLKDAAQQGLSNLPGQAAGELKQMGAHGAHELAAALFTGSAFVMYPRGGTDDPAIEAPKTPDLEQERGGMER